MGISTDAVHAGQTPEPGADDVIPAIHLSTTFAQAGLHEERRYRYGRAENPTRDAWESNVATLEGGQHGVSFASGLAAIDAVASLVSKDERILLTRDAYGGTFRLLDSRARRDDFALDRADTSNVAEVESGLREKTRLVFVETPTNPLLGVADLRALASVCHRAGALLVVDNTFATPCLQRPLDLGADIVVHSTTKFLNGHSDVIGGVVVTSNEDAFDKIRFRQFAFGAVPSPFDCWLALRGVKTLALRMERHGTNALEISRRLEASQRVSRVLYPGLESHPQHALAKREMSGFGGIVSVDLGSAEHARRFLESLSIFALAESLGGVESLAAYPWSMTHGALPPESREELGISPGLVRLSVGIEDFDDLWKDIERSLDAAGL